MKKKNKDMTLFDFIVQRYRSVGDCLASIVESGDFWSTLKWINYNLPDDVPALDPKEFADALREYAEYAKKGS